VLIGNYRRRATRVIPLTDAAAAVESVHAGVGSVRSGTTSLNPLHGVVDRGAIEHGLPAEYVDFLRGISAQPPSPAAQALQPLFEQGMALLRRRRSAT
jgi:hypothetical protein